MLWLTSWRRFYSNTRIQTSVCDLQKGSFGLLCLTSGIDTFEQALVVLFIDELRVSSFTYMIACLLFWLCFSICSLARRWARKCEGISCGGARVLCYRCLEHPPHGACTRGDHEMHSLVSSFLAIHISPHPDLRINTLVKVCTIASLSHDSVAFDVSALMALSNGRAALTTLSSFKLHAFWGLLYDLSIEASIWRQFCVADMSLSK